MGSGRNRLLECISYNEALRHVLSDEKCISDTISLFLKNGLPFEKICVLEGGFDKCYDVVQHLNKLGTLKLKKLKFSKLCTIIV